MKKRIYFTRPAIAVLGLAAIAASFPARAADVTGEEPPVPAAPMEVAPVNTWDGAYAGVTGIYGFGSADHTQPAAGSTDVDGWQGGAFAGYNFQDGSVVYGGEADVGFGNIKGTGPTSVSTKVDGTLRARLGFAPSENILVYGTGGLAVARVGAVEGGAGETKTAVGWTAGAGLDVKVTENVFARGEYRYTDYGSETFATGSGPNSVDVSGSKVMMGLGVQF